MTWLLGPSACCVSCGAFQIDRQSVGGLSGSRLDALRRQCLVALTAALGGITVAAGVDRFPPDWLTGTVFSSYLIPGLILAVVVGGSASIAAVATLCSREAGALSSMLAGAILLGWLVGERLILPPAAFSPQFWWLEAIYVAAGLMMVAPAVTVWLADRKRRS